MNLPIDFTSRMNELLGSDYPEFENAFLNNPNYVGVRVTRADALPFTKNILTDKIPWCENGYYTEKSVISGNHPYHISGLLYFQEPSAMAPVSALPIEPDDYILDLCAAPGGKSTQAAEKLSSGGLLVANEIIPKRAEILAENIERLGISNAIVTNESPERLSKKFPGFFDKIIVDAPCSGEGMFRKEPQAIEEWSIAHTEACAVRQQNILDSAISMLRPGGYLVYSTCTFASVENEKNAEYILSNYPDMELAKIHLDGLSDGITPPDCIYDMKNTKRIFPHLAKGEGHFMALFRKKGSSEKYIYSFDNSKAPEVYSDFEKSFLNKNLKGNFINYGEHLYYLNKTVNLDKIKVIRPGLYLGICKKGRFEPSHALALALSSKDFKNTLSLKSDSDELLKYLHGEVISCNTNGWTVVLCDGFPIGWGKTSGGVFKNHFPKKYRI